MPSTVTVDALWQYPIKSTRGRSLDAAAIDTLGIAGDRRWMLVDAESRFLTQREHGALAFIAAEPRPGGLWVAAPGMSTLDLPYPHPDDAKLAVTVWNDQLDAAVASAAANEWFSAYLGFPVRAVYQHDIAARRINEAYAQPDDTVSFADGYPLLLIGVESLRDLNTRLEKPVDMRRFRPNFVVAGGAAYDEDRWRRIRIGEVEFDVAKACSRCVLTTRDPDSGELDPEREPLRSLSRYRRHGESVLFGQNLIPRGRGTVRVGQPVEVLALR